MGLSWNCILIVVLFFSEVIFSQFTMSPRRSNRISVQVEPFQVWKIGDKHAPDFIRNRESREKKEMLNRLSLLSATKEKKVVAAKTSGKKKK